MYIVERKRNHFKGRPGKSIRTKRLVEKVDYYSHSITDKNGATRWMKSEKEEEAYIFDTEEKAKKAILEEVHAKFYWLKEFGVLGFAQPVKVF